MDKQQWILKFKAEKINEIYQSRDALKMSASNNAWNIPILQVDSFVLLRK